MIHKKSVRHNAGQVRIIGGQWRGRKLLVPESVGLRPTTDRMRETLFNWLAPYISQARCLDCFAGSGALGLEALSRHALSATLLELKQPIALQLKKNLSMLGISNGKVINTETLLWLTQLGKAYDLVFIDPPFRKDLINKTIHLLENYQWLAKDALIYVESEAEIDIPLVPVNWRLYREKNAGQVVCRLYKRE